MVQCLIMHLMLMIMNEEKTRRVRAIEGGSNDPKTKDCDHLQMTLVSEEIGFPIIDARGVYKYLFLSNVHYQVKCSGRTGPRMLQSIGRTQTFWELPKDFGEIVDFAQNEQWGQLSFVNSMSKKNIKTKMSTKFCLQLTCNISVLKTFPKKTPVTQQDQPRFLLGSGDYLLLRPTDAGGTVTIFLTVRK